MSGGRAWLRKGGERSSVVVPGFSLFVCCGGPPILVFLKNTPTGGAWFLHLEGQTGLVCLSLKTNPIRRFRLPASRQAPRA